MADMCLYVTDKYIICVIIIHYFVLPTTNLICMYCQLSMGGCGQTSLKLVLMLDAEIAA